MPLQVGPVAVAGTCRSRLVQLDFLWRLRGAWGARSAGAVRAQVPLQVDPVALVDVGPSRIVWHLSQIVRNLVA